MIRTQEATGKTVDEARTNACALLGVEKDDINVSYEVLEMPQKTGFLGLKLTPAKVRVSVELPDEPVAAPAAPVEEPTPVVEEKAAPVAEPVVEETAPEAPAAVEEPAAPAEEAAPVEEQAAPAAEGEEVEIPINIEENAKVKAAVDYLQEVIEKMGVQDVKFSAVQKGEATIIRLDGEKMGALIGRRGETLDAIQHLTNYAVNRGSDKHMHISVDAESYRAKREESLVRLAEKMAAKAIKYKRSMALEPMNSYERHVIHTALQDYEGVTTSSTGTEPNRRVVVSYEKPQRPSNKPVSREWS